MIDDPKLTREQRVFLSFGYSLLEFCLDSIDDVSAIPKVIQPAFQNWMMTESYHIADPMIDLDFAEQSLFALAEAIEKGGHPRTLLPDYLAESFFEFSAALVELFRQEKEMN